MVGRGLALAGFVLGLGLLCWSWSGLSETIFADSIFLTSILQ